MKQPQVTDEVWQKFQEYWFKNPGAEMFATQEIAWDAWYDGYCSAIPIAHETNMVRDLLREVLPDYKDDYMAGKIRKALEQLR
jgi:hypothetical protein